MNTLYLKLTNACNLRCPFCYNKQNAATMSFEQVKEIINKNKDKNIIFHGGEPLLCKDLILRTIKEFPDIEFSITTNLMTDLDNTTKEILSKCKVASSYSIDRFTDKEQYNKFLDNFHNALTITDITLLVTLSIDQLKQPYKDLLNTIKEINPTNITFERVRLDSITDINEYKQLYRDTDNYLLSIFSSDLLETKKNNLYNIMLESIEKNIPVFCINCDKTVTTIDSYNNHYSCPNGDKKKKKLKECLYCDIYQYCKGDCKSFSTIACSFPKKTLEYIKEGRKNGRNKGRQNKDK